MPKFVLSSPPSDSCHFTLDPNTANRYLHLSEGNRRVERRDEVQSYPPDHPESFHVYYQVLCRAGVSGPSPPSDSSDVALTTRWGASLTSDPTPHRVTDSQTLLSPPPLCSDRQLLYVRPP